MEKKTFLLVASVMMTLACNTLIGSVPTSLPTHSILPSVNPSPQTQPKNTTQPEMTASATLATSQNNNGPESFTPVGYSCSNDYFPVIESRAWFYLIYTIEQGVKVETNRWLLIEIGSVKPGGFTLLTGEIQGIQYQQTLIGDPSATSLEMSCLLDRLTYTQGGPDGLLIPRNIEIGSTWKEAVGTDSETTHTVLGIETVEVSSGAYDAVKISSVISSKNDETIYRWYVNGLGLVKLYIESGGGGLSAELVFAPPLIK